MPGVDKEPKESNLQESLPIIGRAGGSVQWEKYPEKGGDVRYVVPFKSTSGWVLIVSEFHTEIISAQIIGLACYIKSQLIHVVIISR